MLAYIRQANRGKEQTSSSLTIFLRMKVSSVLVLLWENSCCNNNFHFYGSLMLNKLSDYLFKHHFTHHGMGAVPWVKHGVYFAALLQNSGKTHKLLISW